MNGHPFYVHRARSDLSADAGAWLNSDQFQAGDSVLKPDGSWVKVLALHRVFGAAAVYNFEVEQNHDYFVGSSGILVHNQTTCPIGSGGGGGGSMTADQEALKDIVKEATNGGRKPLGIDDANTVLDWADEVNYPGWRAGPNDVHAPGALSPHWTPHIHLPGSGFRHIPVEPGVIPRTP